MKMLSFLFLFLILVGCGLGDDLTESSTNGAGGDAPKTTNGNGEIDEDESVIYMHGRVENLKELDEFVARFQNKEKDEVRITHYTIEGDPIFTDLAYDGKSIKVTTDTTQDKFGSGKVTTILCQSIEKAESSTEMVYSLDCDGKEAEVLYLEYDSAKQDTFEFKLEYGPEMKNIIDTKNMDIVKQLENGQTGAIADFQFSVDEMNKIYKSMVLANYLEEKSLTTSCDTKKDESYKLTVWINSAEKHYEWSECDTSEDGKQMTQMVHEILTVLEENPWYQELLKQ